MREAVSADGLVVGSFLQGSFARKTMLEPIEDVDVVLLLNRTIAGRLPDGADPVAGRRSGGSRRADPACPPD